MGTGSLHKLIAIAAFWTVLSATAPAAETCSPETVEIRGSKGVAAFSVEVVDTPESRAQGLMFREEMAADAGMLFVYSTAQRVAFWMKNTPLPLDIVFINRRGVVCSVAADTTPFSLDQIPSGCAAQTVLEVNAGIAAERGVRVGSPVRHPAILDPVWACE